MPANLSEAIQAFLTADQGLTATIGGRVLGDEADRDEPLPYIVIQLSIIDQKRLAGRAGEIIRYQVTILCFTSSRQSTFNLATQVRDLLVGKGTWVPPKLFFDDGRDVGRIPAGGDVLEIDEERGPAGVDVWRYTLPINWTVARG